MGSGEDCRTTKGFLDGIALKHAMGVPRIEDLYFSDISSGEYEESFGEMERQGVGIGIVTDFRCRMSSTCLKQQGKREECYEASQYFHWMVKRYCCMGMG